MSNSKIKKHAINKNVQINLGTGASKGFIISCAHLQKRNIALIAKYSKGRHLKALRRAQKANKPISCKLPQAFELSSDDLK